MHREPQWGSQVADGLAGIGIGVVTIAWPNATAVVLLYLIAAWTVVFGVMRIAIAIRLRMLPEPSWVLGLTGVASLLFGAVMLVNPAAGALALVWFVGAFAVFVGALMLVIGIRLRTISPSALATS